MANVLRVKSRKAKVRLSAQQLATTTQRLRYVLADVKQVAAFTFVCIEALRAQRKSEVDADVATVLETAFEKILLVRTNARDALRPWARRWAMANSSFKSLRAPHDAIRVEAFRGDWGFYITYRAPSLAALLAAGCVTQLIVDKLNTPTREARVDADGDGFSRKNQATKAAPNRCYVRRLIYLDKGGEAEALALPVVADYLSAQQPETETVRLPPPITTAAGIAGAVNVTCAAKRMRAVGRFQRRVSWATDGKLISPDWRAIRVQALADRLGLEAL